MLLERWFFFSTTGVQKSESDISLGKADLKKVQRVLEFYKYSNTCQNESRLCNDSRRELCEVCPG